jgi:UDP-GlcNAc:undecaprenyl-phosphate GlcNAc-1-phosphate transferase
MGDAGSMMLGFVSAAIMILLARRAPRWWIASIIVFGLPILDTGTAVLRRLLNKRPLFISDRGHIYDQMIDRGIPLNRTVGISYLLAALYALAGLLTCLIEAPYSIIPFVAIFALSFLIVWKLGFLKMEGIRGATHKKVDSVPPNPTKRPDSPDTE